MADFCSVLNRMMLITTLKCLLHIIMNSSLFKCPLRFLDQHGDMWPLWQVLYFTSTGIDRGVSLPPRFKTNNQLLWFGWCWALDRSLCTSAQDCWFPQDINSHCCLKTAWSWAHNPGGLQCWVSLRQDTADFLGRGWWCLFEAGGNSLLWKWTLKSSITTSASWLAHFFSTGLYRDVVRPSSLTHIHSALNTNSGWSTGGRVDITAESLLRRSKWA